jgi:hypothetical protein
MVIVLIIVVAFIASRLISYTAPFRMTMTTPTLQEEEEKLVAQKDYHSLYTRAIDLGKGGQYLEAIRIAYVSILLLLDVHGIIQYHPSLTNVEYCRTVKVYSFYSLFTAVTEIFNTVFYGNQQATDFHFQQCMDAFSQIEEVLT